MRYRKDLATSYQSIVKEAFFERDGHQQDEGWYVALNTEIFAHSRTHEKPFIIRREIFRWMYGSWSNSPPRIEPIIGSLGILCENKLILMCVAGLRVKPETAPNDEHYKLVFSKQHRVMFQKTLPERQHKPFGVSAYNGGISEDLLAKVNPRSYDLSKGKPFEVGQFERFSLLFNLKYSFKDTCSKIMAKRREE